MDLSLDCEQESFVTATADWCRDNMPLEQARTRPQGLWASLEEMGWTAMTTSDMGLDHATEALVFAELGRNLAPVSLLSTAVAARWTGSGAKTALAVPGETGQLRVFDPEASSRALGLLDSGAVLYDLPGVLKGEPGLDLSASLAVVRPAPAVTLLKEPRAALHLQLLAAAFAVGCAEAARDMAAEYAKVREQFERPIGWFQALKHICSDMAVRVAVARSQLCYAACALEAGDSDAAFHVASAKRLADQSALENGRANIQVHGGIGMTDEAYPHYCLKRAHLLSFIAPASRAAILGATA